MPGPNSLHPGGPTPVTAVHEANAPLPSVHTANSPPAPQQEELEMGLGRTAETTRTGRNSSPFDGWSAQPQNPPF